MHRILRSSPLQGNVRATPAVGDHASIPRFGKASGEAKFQIFEGCWAFRPPSPIRAGPIIIRQERTRHAGGFYRDQRSCGPRRTEDTVSKEPCVITVPNIPSTVVAIHLWPLGGGRNEGAGLLEPSLPPDVPAGVGAAVDTSLGGQGGPVDRPESFA